VRLTVIGSGTAQPQPDTPASGLLVETGATTVLLDCGSGVVGRLRTFFDPTNLDAVIVGHLHADHYVDVAPLRYLFPWAGGGDRTLRLLLPPAGRERLGALARAISERPTFFDDGFDVAEYAPSDRLTIGDLRVEFCRARHYVPAWSMAISDPAGSRLVYVGDTGPSDEIVAFAAGADLVVVEATLRSADDDDPERGHLTPLEAIDLVRRAGAARGVLVHYASARRDEIRAECRASGLDVTAGEPGTTIEIRTPAAERGRAIG
jgi:ribonuclease BN (tRNA processing enzyme)